VIWRWLLVAGLVFLLLVLCVGGAALTYRPGALLETFLPRVDRP